LKKFHSGNSKKKQKTLCQPHFLIPNLKPQLPLGTVLIIIPDVEAVAVAVVAAVGRMLATLATNTTMIGEDSGR
jgi:hypothetical protein